MLRLVELKVPSENKPTQIINMDGFSQEELEQLQEANEELKTLHQPAYIKHNFDIAFKFFDEFFKDFRDTPVDLTKNTIDETILYRVKVFLFSGLEFIDTLTKCLSAIWPNIIEREVLKNNRQTTEKNEEGKWILKDIAGQVYDHNFSYRLCYNLRNYLQHVSSEGFSFTKNAEKQTIEVDLKRYRILHTGIQKTFDKELINSDISRTDVLDACYQYKQNMDEIYKKICDKIVSSTTWKEFELSLQMLYLIERHQCNIDLNYYALNNIEECDTSEMIKLNLNYLNLKTAQEYVYMHCRIFDFCAVPVPLSRPNQFPNWVNENNKQIVIEGSEYVKDNWIWRKVFQNTQFGQSNRYFCVYCPAFFNDVENKSCLDIIKKVYQIL